MPAEVVESIPNRTRKRASRRLRATNFRRANTLSSVFFFSAAYQELSFGNTGAVFLSVTDIHNLTDNNSFLDRLDTAEMTLKVTQGH